MISLQQWRDAIQVNGYSDLGKAEDLADRLAIIATLPAVADEIAGGARRFLEHLRAHSVPEENWLELLRLHGKAKQVRHEAGNVLGVLKSKMDGGRDMTDLGLAERIADAFAADLAYSRVLGGWIGWDGRRWKTGDGDQVAQQFAVRTVRRLVREVNQANEQAKAADDEAKAAAEKRAGAVRKFAYDSQRARSIAAAVTLARSEGLAVDADIFDAHPELLTVGNGTIELGERAVLREHRRTDRLTNATDVHYSPSTEASPWTTFVEQALPDADVRRYAQKLVGYSLYGTNDRRLLIFLLGVTSTGKTTFVETIGAILGDHAADFKLSLFAGKQTDAPAPDLMDALPKRFIHASEASSRWKLHADEVKTLTGHDSQRARGMRSDAFLVRKPAFTPWLATNAAPTIEGADQALWRRLVVIPFNQVVDQGSEHAGLSDHLVRKDAAGVLAWAVEGWNLFRAEGLDMPAAVVTASMALRDSLSLLDAWLAEETEQDVEYSTSTDDLWIAYRNWCVEGAVAAAEMGNKRGFSMKLSSHGFGTGFAGGETKRYRVRTGVRLRVTSQEVNA